MNYQKVRKIGDRFVVSIPDEEVARLNLSEGAMGVKLKRGIPDGIPLGQPLLVHALLREEIEMTVRLPDKVLPYR